MALERGKVNVFDSSFVIGIDKTIFIVLYLPPPPAARLTRGGGRQDDARRDHNHDTPEHQQQVRRQPSSYATGWGGVRYRPRAFPGALVLGFKFGESNLCSALYWLRKWPCQKASRFDVVRPTPCK